MKNKNKSSETTAKAVPYFVRSEVLTAVRTLFFWVLTPCRTVGRCQSFRKLTVSIFRTKVAKLGSGEIYIVVKESKAEGVAHNLN
jgi:hypothetical protein